MQKDNEGKIKFSWYAQWWYIVLMLVLAIPSVGITLIVVLMSILVRSKEKKDFQNGKIQIAINELNKIYEEQLKTNEELNISLENKLEIFKKEEEQYKAEIKIELTNEANGIINSAEKEAISIKSEAEDKAKETMLSIEKYIRENEELCTQQEKLEKNVTSHEKKLKKLKVEFLGIKNLIEQFPNAINEDRLSKEVEKLISSFEQDSLLHNLIELDCHYKNSKELRKEMNKVKKDLQKLLDSYVDRYTTKANKTIYQLMVIGLQAEFQNILYTLSYSKLDEAQESAKNLIRKYLAICADGNKAILPTITRFLTDLEPIFLQGIEIEYHYYVKREQEKEEQRAIKEQMRQEAAERKLLLEEQKKLEQEESKYIVEMNRNKELLATETDSEMIANLETRIKELEEQFKQVEEQKEEILKRANGKAGYVYVISNLGSFGNKMFKIGMTRRMEPMDRIDELGDASVPFKFDVHAMVFSDDAVGLEKALHDTLTEQRVNKVNLRKEFFYSDILELQKLVEELDPTVEFKPTLMAQEYRQSLAMKEDMVV